MAVVATLSKGHDLEYIWAQVNRGPVKDAASHSRIAVTLEIYTQTDDEAQLDALARLHNLFDRA